MTPEVHLKCRGRQLLLTVVIQSTPIFVKIYVWFKKPFDSFQNQEEKKQCDAVIWNQKQDFLQS
jgi:hypothetical protein